MYQNSGLENTENLKAYASKGQNVVKPGSPKQNGVGGGIASGCEYCEF